MIRLIPELPRSYVLLGFGLIFGLQATMGQDYSCSFISPPERVVSGQSTPVAIRYRTPPDRGITLNFEIKGANGYHVIARKDVKGEHIEIGNRVKLIARCRLVE